MGLVTLVGACCPGRLVGRGCRSHSGRHGLATIGTGRRGHLQGGSVEASSSGIGVKPRPISPARDPASWDDALRFDPDRFADLTPDQKMLSDEAWAPFGRGPHSCLGFALAQMELTLIVAKVAQRLDLTGSIADLPRPLGMVVNRPEGGAHLRVVRRLGG